MLFPMNTAMASLDLAKFDQQHIDVKQKIQKALEYLSCVRTETERKQCDLHRELQKVQDNIVEQRRQVEQLKFSIENCEKQAKLEKEKAEQNAQRSSEYGNKASDNRRWANEKEREKREAVERAKKLAIAQWATIWLPPVSIGLGVGALIECADAKKYSEEADKYQKESEYYDDERRRCEREVEKYEAEARQQKRQVEEKEATISKVPFSTILHCYI